MVSRTYHMQCPRPRKQTRYSHGVGPMKPDVLRSGCFQAAATDAQVCRSQGAKALDDLTKRMAIPLRNLVQVGIQPSLSPSLLSLLLAGCVRHGMCMQLPSICQFWCIRSETLRTALASCSADDPRSTVELLAPDVLAPCPMGPCCLHCVRTGGQPCTQRRSLDAKPGRFPRHSHPYLGCSFRHQPQVTGTTLALFADPRG